ncbi:hypothetical protein Van01_44050 [Micromonospora andamanensis]|uniref:FXSXX-COOH protein n=1 Tax=Micromonospora andamanensis TaxID=1287068 RepID=A0ABQ4HZZ5_9ACTN|nr:hypothetical protein Van01_44050 [Micromonospora andamanensis]
MTATGSCTETAGDADGEPLSLVVSDAQAVSASAATTIAATPVLVRRFTAFPSITKLTIVFMYRT